MIGSTVILSAKAHAIGLHKKAPKDRKGIIRNERYRGRSWSVQWEGNKSLDILTKDLVEIVDVPYVVPDSLKVLPKAIEKKLSDPPRKRLSGFPVNKGVDDYITNLEREAKELMNKPVAQR